MPWVAWKAPGKRMHGYGMPFPASMLKARSFPTTRARGVSTTPRQVRAIDPEEVRRWRSISRVGVVTVSPHWPDASERIQEICAMGVRVSIGHTHATARQVHDAIDAGATLSTHLGNGIAAMIPRHPNSDLDPAGRRPGHVRPDSGRPSSAPGNHRSHASCQRTRRRLPRLRHDRPCRENRRADMRRRSAAPLTSTSTAGSPTWEPSSSPEPRPAFRTASATS